MNLARIGKTNVFKTIQKICIANAEVSQLVDVSVAPVNKSKSIKGRQPNGSFLPVVSKHARQLRVDNVHV